MNKIIRLCILLLIMIISLASCGRVEDDTTNSGTQIGDNQNNNNNQNNNR